MIRGKVCLGDVRVDGFLKGDGESVIVLTEAVVRGDDEERARGEQRTVAVEIPLSDCAWISAS